MEAAISLANLLTKAVNVSNMSKTVCPALQLEIELVEVFRYVRQKHEFPVKKVLSTNPNRVYL